MHPKVKDWILIIVVIIGCGLLVWIYFSQIVANNRQIAEYNNLSERYNQLLAKYRTDSTNYCNQCERCNMYGNRTTNQSFYINGYYFYDTFYCVWIKDRPISDIQNTENHEICHHLVAKQTEHYCDYLYLNNTKYMLYNNSI